MELICFENLYLTLNLKKKKEYKLKNIFLYTDDLFNNIWIKKVLAQSIKIFFSYKKVFSIFKRYLFLKNNNWILYYSRLKLKGLGFRIKRFGQFLLRFFFGLNNYIYCHVPKEIYVKVRRKKLILTSYSKSFLNKIFLEVLNVRKLIRYFKGIKAKGFFKIRSLRFVKRLKGFGF